MTKSSSTSSSEDEGEEDGFFTEVSQLQTIKERDQGNDDEDEEKHKDEDESPGEIESIGSREDEEYLDEYSGKENISGGGDELEDETDADVLSHIDKVLFDMAEESSKSSSTSESGNEEKGWAHSNAASERMNLNGRDKEFSAEHSTSQSVNEEKGSTHSNVGSENDESEQDKDFSAQHSTSEYGNEERGFTHSNATLGMGTTSFSY